MASAFFQNNKMDFSKLLEMMENVSPAKVYLTIVVCLWAEYVFELYLCIRQRSVYNDSKGKLPKELKNHLDEETFEKSRVYGLDKNNFSIFSEFFGMAVLTGLLHFEGLYKGWELSGVLLELIPYWTWDEEIGKSICFCLIAMVFNNIVGLPLSLYSTFVLEEKHGFNKQSLGFYIKDFIKKILVSAILTCPIIAIIVKIVQLGGQFFFVWLWIFCFCVLMFLMTIYPLVIAPLFDKYTPLQEGPLRDRICALASKISFPLTQLYVVEGSKRSAHSNAYLYGFFNNKRIVLYDTLLKGYVKEEDKDKKDGDDDDAGTGSAADNSNEKKSEEKGCSDEEIEAVLGHELGHWKLNHVVKNIVISQANLLFIFGFFGVFYQMDVVYRAFGFPKNSDKPILIGLIVVLQFLLQIYNTAMSFLMNVLSRLFEFQADEFSVELGYGKELKGALIKLNKDNLGFPIVDELYSAWHHSHPPLLQRLNAIDLAKKKSK